MSFSGFLPCSELGLRPPHTFFTCRASAVQEMHSQSCFTVSDLQTLFSSEPNLDFRSGLSQVNQHDIDQVRLCYHILFSVRGKPA
jgi:hypothetical protein